MRVWILGLSMLAVTAVTSCQPQGTAPALSTFGSVPAFSLRDQDGRTVTLHDLAGQPWVLDFIFTQCPDQCVLMTQKLRRMDLGPEVRRISVTVDPAHDGVAQLHAFAREQQATDPQWRFLTGDKKTILELLKATAQAPQDATDISPGLHSTRFVLVDREGHIRGFYRSDDRQLEPHLTEDARSL